MALLTFHPVPNETSWHAEAMSNVTPSSDRRLTPHGYTTAGCILTLISIIGIFSNLAVVAVITQNRHLRTPVNLMLLSLSASDMIIALFGTPLTAGAAFAGSWIYGPGLCVAYGFCMALTGIASITTLAVISFERYILVAGAMPVVITTRKTVLAVTAVWIYAFAVTFPPVVGWSSIVVENPGIACAPNWESNAPLDLSYELYLLILGLVVPLSAIIFCYYKIIAFVHNQAQTAAGQGTAKGQRKLTQMVALMVTCFLIAWMPYAVVSVIVMAGGKDFLSATATAAPAVLAKSSLIYNPIIYALMNPQIRTAFLAMLTCRDTSPAAQARQLVERPKELPVGFSQLPTGDASAQASSKKSNSQSDSARSQPKPPPPPPPPPASLTQSTVVSADAPSVHQSAN